MSRLVPFCAWGFAALLSLAPWGVGGSATAAQREGPTLWLGTGKGLVEVDVAAGEAVRVIPVGGAVDLVAASPDEDEVWLVSGSFLMSVGKLKGEVRTVVPLPAGALQRPVELLVDPRFGDPWLRFTHRLVHFRQDGLRAEELPAASAYTAACFERRSGRLFAVDGENLRVLAGEPEARGMAERLGEGQAQALACTSDRIWVLRDGPLGVRLSWNALETLKEIEVGLPTAIAPRGIVDDQNGGIWWFSASQVGRVARSGQRVGRVSPFFGIGRIGGVTANQGSTGLWVANETEIALVGVGGEGSNQLRVVPKPSSACPSPSSMVERAGMSAVSAPQRAWRPDGSTMTCRRALCSRAGMKPGAGWAKCRDSRCKLSAGAQERQGG